MPASLINRLQTPLRVRAQQRLSANFRRPQPLAIRAQRGQKRLADEMRNRCGIFLIEVNYKPDIGARVVDLGLRNGALGTVSIHYPGGLAGADATTPITAGELDQNTLQTDQDGEAYAVSGVVIGRRRLKVPVTYPIGQVY